MNGLIGNKAIMNILIDINRFDPKIGASNDMLDLANYSDDTTRFFITGSISSNYHSLIDEKGIGLIKGKSISYARSMLPLYIISVLFWIFKLAFNRIDVVHLNYVSWGPSIGMAARILKIPIVSRAGGQYTKRNKTFGWVSQYVANCKEQAANQLSGPQKDCVNIVGDLVDVDRIERDRKIATDVFNHSSTAVNIVFVGQLTERKGLHILVQAFLEQQENAHLYLVGGDWESEGYAQQIKSLVTTDAEKQKVHFLNHRNDAISIVK